MPLARTKKIAVRIGCGLFFLAAVVFILHQWSYIPPVPAISGERLKNANGIAFVFSDEVHKDGTLGESTKSRLDAALTLYNQGSVGYFLLSGGTFKKWMREPIADPMERYLKEQGVSGERIIKEPDSVDTVTNILFGYRKLVAKFGPEKFPSGDAKAVSEQEWQQAFRELSRSSTIYWVSSQYHLPRIYVLLRNNNLFDDAQKFVAPDTFKTPWSLESWVNEFVARILLKFEPDGRGRITAFLRNHVRSK